MKGVSCDPACVHCETTEENEWHAFFGFNLAREVWVESGLWHIIQPMFEVAEGFSELIWTLLSHLSSTQKSLATMVIWSLWGQRNDKVWDNTTPSVFETARKAVATLDEWVQVRNKECCRSSVQQRTDQFRWKKPSEGYMTCNVDAAMFLEQNLFGVGMYLRNEKGEFVKAKTICMHGSRSASEAEAVGLLESIIWLRDMNVANISIELDNLPVVEGMRGNRSNLTEFDNVLSRCQSLLNSSNNFGISYVRRQANRVAHELARAS